MHTMLYYGQMKETYNKRIENIVTLARMFL